MRMIPAKTIISGYSSGENWFGANYTMNLYKGCCHGCIYCDSRSDCYRVENFDEVRVKEKALAVVERDLLRKRRRGIVITGSMSDPYNPFEEELELTRGALRLIDRNGFGFIADTKSPLAARDLDLLLAVRSHSPTAVNFTVTAADDALCKKIERHVAPTSGRFAAMEKLSAAGVTTGVLFMPILPFLTDTVENVTAIVRMAHNSGARYVFPGFSVTLRQNQRLYFLDQLDRIFPGVKAKYINTFGGSYCCAPPNEQELWQAFTEECERRGLLYQMPDIIAAIRRGYNDAQISLF